MSTPLFDPEDPQLTAYALGELTDPAERAEVEHLLQHSPEAHTAMKEIQDLTTALTAEYEHERRTAVEEPAVPPAPNVIRLPEPSPVHRRGWVRPWLAAAAGLLLAGFLAFLSVPGFQSMQVKGVRALAESKPAASGDAPSAAPVPAGTPAASAALKDDPTVKLAQVDPLRRTEDPSRPQTAEASAASSSSRLANLPAPISPPGEAQPLGPPPELAKSKVGEGSTATLSQSAGASPKAGFDGFVNYGSPIQVESAPGASVGGRANEAGQASGRSGPAAAGGMGGSTVAKRSLPSRSLAAAPALKIATDRASDFAQGGPVTFPGEDARYRSPIPAKPIVGGISPDFNTAAYDHLVENPFLAAKENPLSTFSIDVDTASYANVRRFLDAGSLPPPDAVRLEELINYFPYDYAPPAPDSGQAFAVHLEAASCPWAPEHRLVRIGLKGKEIATDKRPASNLVFLLDVSGSMMPPERLPLIKRALSMLVEHLTENDHVAVVTYAGNSGLALPSTSGDHKDKILDALDHLEAGGGTNGASGITLAYRVAREGFIKGGTNRVILATDGDFNVGVTSQGDLIRMIQKEAKSGVFLSALGVGTDNFKDSTMQKLADKGNGNYHYLDRLEEARKVLVEQMSGTLLTIAKDVKIQVEFNPAAVGSYRLLGYEKRMLRKEDFNDDRIDAGEIGAGHSVTALYEVVPVGQPTPGAAPAVDALKYGAPRPDLRPTGSLILEDSKLIAPAPEMLTLKMRAKAPDAEQSERTYDVPLVDRGAPGDFAQASPDFKFAAAVAAFGLVLRDSPDKGSATLGAAVEIAQEGKGSDPKGYRAGFIELVRKAETLKEAR